MMKKIRDRKGFTLAELLIVVAIIAVLVAVAIPVFTAQLNNAKLATGTANARSAYAEYVADCLGSGTTPTASGVQSAVNAADLQGATATVTASSHTVQVSLSGAGNSPVSFSIDGDIN
ncbi:type II secretion system protein [Butyrivibrio sp. FCS014]|uniref:type II secretion system protein n=1 Tax=Butyrivibrio sp. FCS014 TaxID=1408304 RepID=UPI0004655CCF|nr:prepilin-type N-terminal cleavage/methylation domain-containing protein [Butyrivibrio sp. FCS014]